MKEEGLLKKSPSKTGARERTLHGLDAGLNVSSEIGSNAGLNADSNVDPNGTSILRQFQEIKPSAIPLKRPGISRA